MTNKEQKKPLFEVIGMDDETNKKIEEAIQKQVLKNLEGKTK
jgi:hypothetical protein|tara:strand:+ start:267 stop:392 length:126 start_codon:yes stop_codon:yes gene_type:complete